MSSSIQINEKEQSSTSIESAAISFAQNIAFGNITYLNEQLKPFQELTAKKDSRPYHQIFEATHFYYTGKYKEAELLFSQLLKEEWNNPSIEGCINIVRGSNSRSLGEMDTAVTYLNKGIRSIPNADPLEIYSAFAHYQLGDIFLGLKEYERAEEHYLKGLQQAESIQHTSALFRMKTGLGTLYLNLDRLTEAYTVLLEANGHAKGNLRNQSKSYHDLALYYLEVNDTEQALKMCEAAISIRLKEGLKDAAITTTILKAKVLLLKGETKEIIAILRKTLKEVRSLATKVKERDCLALLSQAYEQEGKAKKALKCLKKHNQIEFDLLNKQHKKILKQKNKQIQGQKDEIEAQHQEITASIQYAERLQAAILPTEEMITESFPKSFVYYRPKDIVAGDFYWLNTTVANDYVFFAAADCTGHGVPGAMVSFVCSEALNRTVKEFGLYEPGEILNKVRELVIERFSMSKGMVKDGMDISFCALNNSSLELKWAGANNPLYIIRDEEITVLKGDRQAIGYSDDLNAFKTHEIQLKKDDVLYLGTDGFPDQFGGPKGKKYGYRKYREFLMSIHQNSMSSQSNLLEEEFKQWSKNEEQIDDVCILGIQL